ncbi:MAG: cell division protein FtsZ [Alphaproteobacteria bacterium]|nr:cell division protein FtsZ [Alphaproteobacteria bacterium]
MSINLGVADTTVADLKPRIAVVGVGGGGGNAVNNMIAQNLGGVDFIVANTDAQALAHSSASNKIQLGLEITKGLGAGARPEIGKMAAEEAKEKIADSLNGMNMVFITAGMGGGTGSGAAPVVAHIAKEKGILTVGVVTKPFGFEGKKRMEIADRALESFIKEVDSIIVIPNQNLFRVADENTTLSEAFKMADNVLYSGVRSITDLMMMPGLINLDFADVRNIMEDKGKAIMGTGEAGGKGRAKEAAKQALSNPLLDDCTMQGAKGVLINITGGQDITLPELAEAADTIKEEVGDDANIIFGSSYDEGLEGKIRVSIVVTGINDGILRREEPKVPAEEPSLIDQSYDDTTFVPTVDVPAYNPISEQEETQEENESIFDELNEDITSDVDAQIEELSELSKADKTSLDDDFASLDKSEELPEVPQASALFTAIMNNDNKSEENEKADEELNALVADDDFFSGNTSIEGFGPVDDEEPILFKGNDTSIFKGEEPQENEIKTEKEDVSEETESTRPSFIERVIGIRTRRKANEDLPKRQEVKLSSSFDSKTGTDDDFDISGEDLDIPAFLRRK